MNGIALVTGASAGIGFEIAAEPARRGYDIVGVGASGRSPKPARPSAGGDGAPGPGGSEYRRGH